MNSTDISQPVFHAAVAAIDQGDLPGLQKILTDNSGLVAKRSGEPAEGYFKHPYLLWFVAGNPVRQEQLPADIVPITHLLIQTARQHAANSFPSQIDYALELVATSRIARESGVQLELMDLLINAGANSPTALGALAHGNIEAAKHLLKRGGKLTLPVAVAFGQPAEVEQLLPDADSNEIDLALVVAAFFGQTGLVRILIDKGANVNAYPDLKSGFHSHATALHQAVQSGSIETVSMLAAAGADRSVKDKFYDGTAVEWAIHLEANTTDLEKKKNFAAIKDLLQSAG